MNGGRNPLAACVARNVLVSNSGLGVGLACVAGVDDVDDVVWLLAVVSSSSLARASATAFALIVLSSLSSVWTALAFSFVRGLVVGVAADVGVSSPSVSIDFTVNPVPVCFMYSKSMLDSLFMVTWGGFWWQSMAISCTLSNSLIWAVLIP